MRINEKKYKKKLMSYNNKKSKNKIFFDRLIRKKKGRMATGYFDFRFAHLRLL